MLFEVATVFVASVLVTVHVYG